MIARTMVLIALGASAAAAQSTAGLGRFERRTTYQMAAGVNSQSSENYGRQMRASGAVDFTVRRELAGPMNLRLDAWYLRRRAPANDDGSVYFDYRFDAETNQSYAKVPRGDWFVAIVPAAERPFHIGRDFVVTPILGIGWVPIARGRFVEVPQEPDRGPSIPVSSTSHGFAWTTGISVSWRHLVIEQHLVEVSGADAALFTSGNAPITIGWRF